jgi:phthiocerol/phenolphthiocerol synthesis type-I polyketide synthase B
VRQFVLFSSISGVIGSRWLGHYTAAGAFLDTFAYTRRALGLPATVVDWGLWKSVDEEQPETTDVGLQPMPSEVAIRALPVLLSSEGGVRSAVVAADWNMLAGAYRMRGSLRVVDELLDDDTADHTQHWITIEDPADAAGGAPRPGTLLGKYIEAATTPPVQLWQARLRPDAMPYPGAHRVQGVDVVPASVLLQTLSTAAAECGAPVLSDVRFEYPIVVDQPRVIQVVADAESLTVSTSPVADAPTQRGVRHASARISYLPPDEENRPDNSGNHEISNYDAASVAELQRAWGIEGQPFGWAIDLCQSAPGGLHADVGLPEASTVALLDAAIHVARLVESSNPRLMFPAAVESAWFRSGPVNAHGTVEVHRRGGNDHELIVDIVGKASDGSTCFDIRSLRYADMESAAAPAKSRADERAVTWDWSQVPSEDRLDELMMRLRAILARELRMPTSAVDVDQSFPELGLDSMMAMTVLRETNQLVGAELSATMLWNHPTISALATYLVDMLAPQEVPQEDPADVALDSASSVLDELFDHVESASAGSESGIF